MLERRDESEVVERLRPQLHGETPDVLKRRDDELTEVGGGLPQVSSGLPASSTARRPEQDRCQRLARLVVQLACEASPLELLAGDDAAQRIPGDTPGKVDRDRRPVRELLGEPQVSAAEAGIRAELVVRDEDADRSVPGQAAARRDPSRRRGVGRRPGSTSGSSSSESTRSLRPRSSTRPVFESRSSSLIAVRDRLAAFAVRRRDPQASPAGSAMATRRAPISSRSRRRNKVEQRAELELADESARRSRSAIRAAATRTSPIRRDARSRPRRRPARRAAMTSSSSSSVKSPPPSFSVR